MEHNTDCSGCLSWIRCWSFTIAVVVSVVAMTVAILGMCGVFSDEIPHSYFSGLLTFVIGVWVPQPETNSDMRLPFLSPQKTRKKKKKLYPDSTMNCPRCERGKLVPVTKSTCPSHETSHKDCGFCKSDRHPGETRLFVVTNDGWRIHTEHYLDTYQNVAICNIRYCKECDQCVWDEELFTDTIEYLSLVESSSSDGDSDSFVVDDDETLSYATDSMSE